MWVLNFVITVCYVFNPLFLPNIVYYALYKAVKNNDYHRVLYLSPLNIYVGIMGCIMGSFYTDNITYTFHWITGINPYEALTFNNYIYTKSVIQSFIVAYHIFPTLFFYVYGSMLLTHVDFNMWYRNMTFNQKLNFYWSYYTNCMNTFKVQVILYNVFILPFIYNLNLNETLIMIMAFPLIIKGITILTTYSYDLGFLPYQNNRV